MKMSRGFIGVGVLIAILLGLIVVGGGAYYMLSRSTGPTPVIPTNTQTLPTAENTQAQQVQTTPSTHVQTPPSTQPVSTNTAGGQVSSDTADCPYHVQNGQVYLGVTPIAGADPATFTNESVKRGDWTECIGKDNSHVVVQFKVISGSNASQFSVLPPNGTGMCKELFRIRGAGVFIGVWQLSGADPNSFIDMTPTAEPSNNGTCYGKDATHVYSSTSLTGQPSIIVGADPNAFAVLNSNYTHDASHAWWIAGEYDKGNPISGADGSTFAALSSGYAKDASHVFSQNAILAGADPATFVSLSDGFAKDATHVYDGSTVLTGIDPATVVVLDSSWLKDKNHVYATPFLSSVAGENRAIVQGADPSTFVALGLGYGKDSNNVYWSSYYHNSAIVQGADVKTFEVASTYAKDANHIYDIGTVLTNADVTSFHRVGNSIFYADKSHIWTTGEIGTGAMSIIQGADPNTFVLTGTDTAKDANHTYSFDAKGYLLVDGSR